jgi:hypothetical protein
MQYVGHTIIDEKQVGVGWVYLYSDGYVEFVNSWQLAEEYPDTFMIHMDEVDNLIEILYNIKTMRREDT